VGLGAVVSTLLSHGQPLTYPHHHMLKVEMLRCKQVIRKLVLKDLFGEELY